MNPFWQAADFIRELRRKLRFGTLSRAPLRLLRFDLRGQTLACDWMTRPADAWDADLRRAVSDRNESFQALADAMEIRELVFDALPEVERAILRAFRKPAREPPELIIAGSIHRDDPLVHKPASLVMRAKLSGFRFSLDGNRLEAMRSEIAEMSFCEEFS